MLGGVQRAGGHRRGDPGALQDRPRHQPPQRLGHQRLLRKRQRHLVDDLLRGSELALEPDHLAADPNVSEDGGDRAHGALLGHPQDLDVAHVAWLRVVLGVASFDQRDMPLEVQLVHLELLSLVEVDGPGVDARVGPRLVHRSQQRPGLRLDDGEQVPAG